MQSNVAKIFAQFNSKYSFYRRSRSYLKKVQEFRNIAYRRKDIVQERKGNTIEAVHAIRWKCKSKADVVESADWKPSNVKLRNTCSPKRLHSNRFRAFAASCSRCLLEETFSFRVRERIRSIDQNCRRPSNARESIVPLPRYNNKANTRNVLDH